MSTFGQLCERHQCDKGRFGNSIGHGYQDEYASVLDPIRNNPVKLLEIGVGGGASTKVWLDYFTHPQSRIFGIDIGNCHHEQNPRFTLVHGDQSSQYFWTQFLCQNGYDWDVVVDDGSHKSDGIITTFECVWPYLKSGAIYIIEDLRCSYMPGYESPGWPKQMVWVKNLLDDINAQTSYKPAADSTYVYPPGTDGWRGIKRLIFSEELCILIKK